MAAIVNRLTATWYLKEQRIQAALLHGFVLTELGRDHEASEAIDEVVALGQSEGGLLDLGDMPQRLAKDAEDGAFFVPQGVWRVLGRRMPCACTWAAI